MFLRRFYNTDFMYVDILIALRFETEQALST